MPDEVVWREMNSSSAPGGLVYCAEGMALLSGVGLSDTEVIVSFAGAVLMGSWRETAVVASDVLRSFSVTGLGGLSMTGAKEEMFRQALVVSARMFELCYAGGYAAIERGFCLMKEVCNVV